MNKFKTFIGIDVSKKTFDAAVLQNTDPHQIHHHSFAQSAKGYASFHQWLQEQGDTSQMLVCLEHTGIYINGLVEF
jgi:transposase